MNAEKKRVWQDWIPVFVRLDENPNHGWICPRHFIIGGHDVHMYVYIYIIIINNNNNNSNNKNNNKNNNYYYVYIYMVTSVVGSAGSQSQTPNKKRVNGGFS